MKILIDGSGGFPAEPGSNDEPKWEPGRFPLHVEISGDSLGVLVFLGALPAVLHIGTQRGCPSRWWRS